ncbi:LOW QUALITY PROTEIN: hypothetical protein MKX08_004354 [Trichoderma sp. CBMAI-0020]|nr:LOW QUALITY PROTEIN: hypothetical protein MKX08_004354 [Trichoderma sp. CBMAI-0020]
MAPILGELVSLYTSSKYSLLRRVNGGLVDLLEQKGSERLDTRSQKGRVEGHVNASERDCGKATLQLQRQGLLESRLGASADNLLQSALSLLNVVAHLFNVNLLHLEEVGHSSERVQSAQVTGAHVLHVGNVVVDNLQQPASLFRNLVNDKLKGLFVEYAAGVDGAHGVVGSTAGVTLDGHLHRQATVEDDRHQTLNGHDLCQGSQGRVFSQRVAGKGAVSGDESLGLHVLEAGLFHQRQGGLNSLRLDGAIGSHRLESHGHVVLADRLTPGATKVHSELLGVVLDDVGDGEAVVVKQLDLDRVVGKNHANQRSVEATDSANVVLGSPCLDQASDRSAAVHARNGILKVDRLVQRGAVTLKVVNDGVAVRLAGLVIDTGDLDDLLGGQLQQDLATGLHAAEDAVVLESHEALQAECQRLAKQVNLVGHLVESEPLLGSQHCHVHLNWGLVLALEGVLKVGVGTAVQELRGNFHHGLAISADGTANLNHLARVLVDDGIDLCNSRDLVALLEGLSARNHAEAVGKVHQLQQVTVNGAGEDGLSDGLPSQHNRKVHGRIHDLARPVNESFASVADGVNKVVDGFSSDSGAASVKLARDNGIEIQGLFAEPCLPVKLLDAVIAALHYFMDGSISSIGAVQEFQRHSNRSSQGSCLLNHVDEDLLVAIQLDLNHIHILVVSRLLLNDNGSLGGVVRVLDLDVKASDRGEDTADRVGLELLALNNNIRHEKGVSPVAESREGMALAGDEERREALDVERDLCIDKLATKVFGSGDQSLIVVVQILGQRRNVGIVDVVQNVLDGLINDSRELGGGRALKYTGSADVLANDCVKVFRLPQRVLLEVKLKVLVKSRNESDRLLAGAQAQNQEVLNILCVDDLVLSFGIAGEDSVHSAERLLKVGVALEERRLASLGGESLLDSVDEIASHVLKIHGLAILVAAEPDLLEVVIQLLDDVVSVLLELGNSLLLGDVENLLVHLSPELDTASGQLVNWLAHFRAHSDDATGRALVGHFPLSIIETRGVDNGLLGVLAGVRLLGYHHTATKQAAVKGHRGVSVLLSPVTGDVWVSIISTAEATACNQDDVLLSADAAIHLENRLVEIFKRVMTTATATGPLHDDREGRPQGLNVLLSDLNRGHTGTNGQTFDRHTISTESAKQGDLPAHGARVDVDEVDSDTAASGNGLFDLLQCRSHVLGVEVAATSKLDVVTSVHGSRNKVPRDSSRGHTSDHDRRDAKKTAHLGVHILFAARCLDQAWAMLLNPVNGKLDGVFFISIKDLRLVSELAHGALNGTSEDDADTSSLLVSARQGSKARDAAWAKIKNVASLGEDRRLLPVNGIPGDESDQSRHDVAIGLSTKVLASVCVVNWNSQSAGVNADVLEVFINEDSGVFQVLAVERSGNGKESVGESDLSLGVRDSSLIQTGRGLHLAELRVQTVQRGGRTSDNEVAGAIDERNANVTVRRKVLVCSVNVLLNFLLGQITDAQHWRRKTFTVLLRLSKHCRSHGCSREGLLTSGTNPEQNGQDRGGDFAPRIPRVGRGRGSCHDNTLGVTSGSTDSLSEETRVNAQDLASNLVVCHLNQSNQRETDGCGNQIVDVWSGLWSVKPRQNVQALGEHLLRAGVAGESLQKLGSVRNELSNKA